MNISADLKECMHNRDTFKITAIKSNDPLGWAKFKRMRNKINAEFKAAILLIGLSKPMATPVKRSKSSTTLPLESSQFID